MSYLPNRFSLDDDYITFSDKRPCIITCNGGTHNIHANGATSVATAGQTTASLALRAVAATTVNLSSLTACSGLDLMVVNPILTLPADVAGAFTFTSTSKTSIAIPGSCTSVLIAANVVSTITSIGTLGAITSFSLNNMGAVNSAGIELILAACAAAGSAVTVDISGGTHAVPTGLGGATAASGEIMCPSGPTFPASGSAAWVKPRWKMTEQYFWFNVDFSNTDPTPGGMGIEISISAGDNESTIGGALRSAMDANGYSVSGSSEQVYYTLDDAGLTIPASQDGGGIFLLQNETSGSSGNASINTIHANGGSVTHNT